MEIIILFALILRVAISCPRSEAIRPCTCNEIEEYKSQQIVCSEIYDEEDIINAGFASKNHEKLRKFSILNSVFNYIPENAFDGISFDFIEIQNSSLAALSDTDSAFKGLEKYLAILTIKDCMFLSQWEWKKLKTLHSLKRIMISGTEMPTIEEDINLVNGVATVNFSNNAISWIHENAFSGFANLSTLSLLGNKISKLRRSMLPTPASVLGHLDLSHNLIEQFPEDLFTEMPTLHILSINNNRILTLEEKTFSPVWEQLQFVEATGNDLRCDCRLSWMLQKKKLEGLRAFCAEPQTLKGKDLKELTTLDLWC